MCVPQKGLCQQTATISCSVQGLACGRVSLSYFALSSDCSRLGHLYHRRVSPFFCHVTNPSAEHPVKACAKRLAGQFGVTHPCAGPWRSPNSYTHLHSVFKNQCRFTCFLPTIFMAVFSSTLLRMKYPWVPTPLRELGMSRILIDYVTFRPQVFERF